MSAARRWCIVAVGVILLVASPLVVRALPVSGSDVSARTLLHRISASRDKPFSGYAETAGNVALPANDALSSLTKLLSTTNQVRVWWRDPQTWRVATLRATGETDLVHAGNRMVRWVYESKRATLIPDVPVRLPETTDLLPNELARHVLAGARTGELSRLPARRVAGREALGLRLVPADSESSVGHVDVWADAETGVPLRVEVYARGAANPAVTSDYLDFTPGRPSRADLDFTPPHDAKLRYDDVVDLAAAANRFASRTPPATLDGLPARSASGAPLSGRATSPSRGALRGSVGVYGRGPTVLLAIPLWSRTAHEVRDDLEKRPGVTSTDEGLLIQATPLRLLLADPEHDGTSWLLAGTVTEKALGDAAAELAAHPPASRARR